MLREREATVKGEEISLSFSNFSEHSTELDCSPDNDRSIVGGTHINRTPYMCISLTFYLKRIGTIFLIL